jgi:hypothetical protein
LNGLFEGVRRERRNKNKKLRNKNKKKAPPVGAEPTTLRLTAARSEEESYENNMTQL